MTGIFIMIFMIFVWFVWSWKNENKQLCLFYLFFVCLFEKDNGFKKLIQCALTTNCSYTPEFTVKNNYCYGLFFFFNSLGPFHLS